MSPAPYFDDGTVTLYLGDCRQVLPALPDASVDAVVCDPPYEIGFMGRRWDASGIAYDTAMWRQVWRVLKPGGHLLAFGATRTYHRLAVAIEDAGFEIRDSIHWIYGNGFPKGQDVAKSIDRRRDDGVKIRQVTAWLAEVVTNAGWTTRQLNDLFGFVGMAGHWVSQGKTAAVPTPEQWARLRDAIGFDDSEILPLVQELTTRKGQLGEAWNQREILDRRNRGRDRSDIYGTYGTEQVISLPASELARKWEGWNTNLKPAYEPILVARRSTGFNTTVANVLEHGTGALNIDACRINGERWPTNVVFTHSAECNDICAPGCPLADLGDNTRFFSAFRYEAKAPASERPRLADGTVHTTVKPLELMRWLVRLVTPPGGAVLDPFAGSGTTLEACTIEGFRAVGIEKEPPYAELCVKRLSKTLQPVLNFDAADGAA